MNHVTTIHVAFLTCAIGVMTASGGRCDNPVPQQIDSVKVQQRLGNQVPLHLRFKDENGQTVFLNRYFQEKPVILVLAYYRCPRMCSDVLNGLTTAMRGMPINLGEHYTVLTVSFDPREKPPLAAEKRKAYLRGYGRDVQDNDWHFLTGDEENIKQLKRAVGFVAEFDKKTNQYQHAAAIMVLTPKGKVAHYLFGVLYDARDLRKALADAGGGRIGAPLNQVLILTCLTFDPSTGRYTLSILKILRAAAVLTVMAVGGYVVWNLRRQVQRPAAQV